MRIPNGWAQANFIFDGPCVPTGAEITLGLEVASFDGGPEDVAGVLVDEWVTAAIMDLQSEDIRLDRVRVKFGPNDTGPDGEQVADEQGTKPGNGEQPNTAALIKKLTATGGRSGKGRMFFPGISAGLVGVSGDMIESYDGEITGAWENYRTALVAADIVPALLHAEATPGDPAPLAITHFACDIKVATQRRRLRR